MRGGDAGAPHTSMMETIGERIVALLLLLMAATLVLLWSLNPLTTAGQDAFAIYLAVEFVAFAMLSYIYRTLNADDRLSKILLIAGCALIAALFFLSLTV